MEVPYLCNTKQFMKYVKLILTIFNNIIILYEHRMNPDVFYFEKISVLSELFQVWRVIPDCYIEES